MAGLAGWLRRLAGFLAGWPGGIRKLEQPNVDFSLVLTTFLLAGLALGWLAGWAGWLAGLLAGWLAGLELAESRRRQMLIFPRF